MKTSGNFKNGQPVLEQDGDTLTYYHVDGSIKAQGPCIDGQFQGKWIFNKKSGQLWNVGHFKDNQKHGEWTRYKPDGTVEKTETFERGKKVN